MCRWIAFCGAADGQPVPLADVLCKPVNSLLEQAAHAAYHPGFTGKNNAVLNADGFGCAWYSPDGCAAVFKSVQPAWSDANLRELSRAVFSRTVFGHVRAASPGSLCSHENTHPFRRGRLVFMHNGHVEGGARVRRAMLAGLSDDIFSGVAGLTDSEAVFALVASFLRDPERAAPFAPAELAAAMRAAVAAALAAVARCGVTGGFTTLNCALTDGETVVATRFCDRWPAVPPPSLYFSFATHAELRAELDAAKGAAPEAPPAAGAGAAPAAAVAHTAADISDERWARDRRFLDAAAATANERTLVVASEPATEGSSVAWLAVPAQAMLVFTRGSGRPPELTQLLCPAE